ncbi:hypothetical protein CIRG_02890 [Coccidioides immitis RMSCC 2394]|uniref:Uncharacterized protein n=1 Tax=Coccidioides immitis RMSCC 2394 TaxID=404692 RepID=A0A0J6Y8U3_COCIT|nr:hypothetical protein CIRG_02890 [Coccidioides immitis RMSCC 2394]
MGTYRGYYQGQAVIRESTRSRVDMDTRSREISPSPVLGNDEPRVVKLKLDGRNSSEGNNVNSREKGGSSLASEARQSVDWKTVEAAICSLLQASSMVFYSGLA